jgi:1,4-alpha-glucan branching enzyme
MIKRDPGESVVRITFEVPASAGAETAHLCGDFNDWSLEATPMTRLDGGGFRVTVPLVPGRRWRFRYLLDGHRWENDWAADDYEPNAYGGQDSVVDLAGSPYAEPREG